MRQELLLVIPKEMSVGTSDPKVNGSPGGQYPYALPSLS